MAEKSLLSVTWFVVRLKIGWEEVILFICAETVTLTTNG